MTQRPNITVSIPADLIKVVDEIAVQSSRSRSQTLELLSKIGAKVLIDSCVDNQEVSEETRRYLLELDINQTCNNLAYSHHKRIKLSSIPYIRK